MPQRDSVKKDGVTYVIGKDATPHSAAAKRVWVVNWLAYPMPVSLAPGFGDRGVVASYGTRERVDLRLYERE